MKMKTGIFVIALLFSLTQTVTAQDSASAIVQKGIEAQGGKQALAKLVLCKRASKGKSFFGGEQTFTDLYQLALPNRMRFSLTLGKENFSMCLDGDQGWALIGGFPNDLAKDKVDEMKDEAYFLHVASLVPLLDSKAVLSSAPDGKVENKPTQAVKARLGTGTEILLSFEKETGLLLKAERKAKQSGVEVIKAVVYGDYQLQGGVKVPTKETHFLGGNKLAEVQEIRYEFVTNMDPGVFKKP